MRRTRLGSCLAAAALALTLPTTAMAYEDFNSMPNLSAYETRVMIDGAYAASGAQPVILEGGEAALPLRVILEGADYQVSWDNGSRSVVAESPDGADYTLAADSGILYRDGEMVWTDQDAGLRNNSMYVSEETFTQFDGLGVSWDRATNTAVVTTEHPADNLYVYDLGEGALKNPSRPDTAYQMQGIVGVPEGTNRPVVVILHGSHPIEKSSENRYDLGFAHLVDALADAGYLAVSMNIGINYSFEDGEPIGNTRTVQIVQQQLDLLQDAIDGKQGAFPCDLTGKGDLSQVILLGHSRGGGDLFTVAQEVEGIEVRGLLAMAPAKTTPVEEGVSDIPTGIIIPQYDGDVTMLDGATIFEDIRSNDVTNAELIYLEAGNHGGFSTALVAPDPFGNREDLDKIMPTAQQQAFLRSYTLDFVKSVLETGKTPLAGKTDLPDNLYGCPVVTRVYDGGKTLYSAQTDAAAKVTASGAAVEAVSASYMPDSTAGTFNLPGSFADFGLLRVSWDKADASVTIPVSDISADASALRLDLALDSSDARVKGQDVSMTVTVRDSSGKEASVTYPAGTAPLRYQAGTLRSYDNWDGTKTTFYSTFTPLGSLRLDLSSLEGIKPRDITQITLTFHSDSGSVMVREITAES